MQVFTKNNVQKHNTVSGIIDNTNTGPDFWETKIECITECSKAPENICIWIHPLAKEKIETLMEEYTNIEWLAYLLGEFGEKIEVTDIFIPDQEITSASVDNIVCKEFNDLPVIGVIHSHHTMGNTFSGTDDKYINQNHNISLCISNSGIKWHVRWTSPCGAYKIVDCTIKVKTESLLNKDEFLTNAKEKIKKKTFTTIYHSGWPEYEQNGYYNSRPGGYVNRNIPINVNKPNMQNNLSDVLSDEETEEIENEIEELDFSKEQSIEEEMSLIKEMDEVSTDFDDNEYML